MFKPAFSNLKIIFVISIIIAIGLIFVFVSKYKELLIDNVSSVITSSQEENNSQDQSFTVAKQPTINEKDNFFGVANAIVTVFVFEDYADLFSANLADDLEKARLAFGDKIVIVVRPYISQSELSSTAALAVLCAAEQGKWKEMRALLFARAKSFQLTELDLDSYSRQLDLSAPDLENCLTRISKSGIIEQATAQVQEYQIGGAPTIFINGEMIPGARPFEDYVDSSGEQVAGLKTIIDRKINNVNK